MLLYNIRVLLKTISRDTEHVTNFHKQCQNFAEKSVTLHHIVLINKITVTGENGQRKTDVAAGPGQEKC